MKAIVSFWNIQKMESKTKTVKVYGQGENSYILYKGDKVPLKALQKLGYDELFEMEKYRFNVFSYYYESAN